MSGRIRKEFRGSGSQAVTSAFKPLLALIDEGKQTCHQSMGTLAWASRGAAARASEGFRRMTDIVLDVRVRKELGTEFLAFGTGQEWYR